MKYQALTLYSIDIPFDAFVLSKASVSDSTISNLCPYDRPELICLFIAQKTSHAPDKDRANQMTDNNSR